MLLAVQCVQLCTQCCYIITQDSTILHNITSLTLAEAPLFVQEMG